MVILKDLSQWVFINVIFALLPLIINLIVVSMFREEERNKWKWITLFKNGELFFFSSTISASSMSELVLNDTSNLTNDVGYVHLFILLPLMIVLILSTVIFGCSAYIKLQEQISGEVNSLLDDFRFSYGSIACAVTSIILGYMSFLETRG